MNLQQLEHLIALAETGSFSRAAERVHLTQSALSRSIQMLEDDLGVPLVDRIGKKNELTPFGVEVVARARRISLEALELRRFAQLQKLGSVGELTLGMGSAPRAVLAPALLQHMLNEHPGIRLHLTGGSPAVQLAALRNRTVDALLMTYHVLPEFDGLHIELLEPLASGFLCRANHPLARRASVSYAELAPLQVLSTVISAPVARRFVEVYGAAADPLRWLRATTEEVATLLSAVCNTDAIFWGLIAAGRSQLERGELVVLNVVPSLEIHSRIAFVTLEGRTSAPALQAVRQFCAATIQAQAKLNAEPTKP